MRHLGSITDIHGYDIPPVDCIIGGSPCQDLSVAGKRAGLAGKRSGLFIEQVRIVKEMRDATGTTAGLRKPRYMVWENVPGAFSSNGGEDFKLVLEETIRIAEPQAPDLSVPEKGWTKSGCIYDAMGGWSVAWRVHDAQYWGVPQRRKRISLVADFGGLSAPEVLFERKGLSGNPEQGGSEREGTTGSSENCVGAASYPQNPWGCDRATLRAWEYGHQPTVFDGNGDGKTVPTITGDHENRITDYTCIVLDCGFLDSYNDISPTELARQYKDPIVVMQEIAGTLRANAVCSHTVRRLTPLECERLQGYPDGWTDIGKWTDSRGKKRKSSDSLRYKALGNSIALPFWFYLLRRISAQYERSATLGSLFDGIGGFPLCWEACNGKGTALWASEIDEFCIAVTKMRLGGTV